MMDHLVHLVKGDHISHNEESLDQPSVATSQVKLLTPPHVEHSTPPQDEFSILNQAGEFISSQDELSIVNLPKEPSSRVKLNHHQKHIL
jgi:hypothetical protein